MTAPIGEPAVSACPLPSHTVEVVVIGDDDVGLFGEWVQLRNDGKMCQARTDENGWCIFTGIKGDSASVSLSKLDGSAWELVSHVALSPGRMNNQAVTEWLPETPPGKVPAFDYAELDGDSISAIAVAHGFTPSQVADYADNRCTAYEARTGNEVLAVGSRVKLPPRTQRLESVLVNRRYYLHRIAVPFCLTIRMLDACGRPRRQLPYLLRLSASAGREALSYTGMTDLDGYLIQAIPPGAVTGELRFAHGADAEVYPVRLGALAPVTSIAGVQQRLNNLGYWCGEVSDGPDEATRAALEQFQLRCGLQCTGESDAATESMLLHLHRS